MNDARWARLVAQHAETSRLMGVDFVPLRAAPRGAAGPTSPSPATLTPAALAEPKPTQAAPRAGAPSSGSRDPDLAQRRLDACRERYERDAPHRHFVTDHHSIVFGEGNPVARLMFIGEAPGEEEDRLGRPFVGRSGQLLDRMIAAMGLARGDVYIANVLKTRPPNNATPTLEEAELCAPYLFEQIAAIGPEVIVTLGLPATRLLLRSQEAMARLRAHWWTFTLPQEIAADWDPPAAGGRRDFPVMPTYHPSFVLRAYTPENRRKVWSDLRLVMDRLGLSTGAATV